MRSRTGYDVAVVGGGAAGLSAAIALARSRRRVIVIDAAQPRNADSPAVHNLLGHEGIAPLDLRATGQAEARRYGAELLDGRVATARRSDDGFELQTDDGGVVSSRRLLIATGLIDELPDVPGVAEGWGTGVLHCPYCHGWEVRDRKIGVLATGPGSVQQALLFRQLSDAVTFFSHRAPELDEMARAQLDALDIPIVSGPVQRLRMSGRSVTAVALQDGSEYPVDAVTVAPRFVARADLFEQLGGAVGQHPVGTFIPAEPTGRTALPGVWAAGNAADLAALVAPASAAGVVTAVALNVDLVQEDVAAAVRAHAALQAG